VINNVLQACSMYMLSMCYLYHPNVLLRFMMLHTFQCFTHSPRFTLLILNCTYLNVLLDGVDSGRLTPKSCIRSGSSCFVEQLPRNLKFRTTRTVPLY